MPSLTRLILGRVIPAAAVLAASGVAGLFGLELMRSRAEREIYRDRLADLTATYESLADRYNTAVRRTALTELVVEHGQLTIVVQSAGGRIAEIDTPFDPAGEIYVDYAVIGGRVWIRRVFDENTPPSEGVVIDPAIASIEWDDDEHEVGKAIYRSLGEGRWIVTVAGNGALGLRRVEPGEEIALGPAPAIDRFDVIQDEARRHA
ncbi:MAG: hypothetical protein K8E66_01810, partial [Phycisphaerales bacterium]|nr:hypothetical protein [Phycisphaerales bacterium]